ncbi:MAG: sulfite exporter TauE/SafE family protein [Bdellovibrionales bacterium]|nr:sulfite exporter TauE/SafE family protein [Bdellovibrionales bacterium]
MASLTIFQLAEIGLVAFVAQVGGCIIGGGGFLIQPFLISLGVPPQMAVANDIGGAIASSLSAAAGFTKRNLIRTDIVHILLPGLVVGALLGCFVLNSLPPRLIEKLIGCFGLIFLARVLLFRDRATQPTATRDPQKHRPLVVWSVALSLGAYTTFSGAGIGTLSAVLLARAFRLSFTESLGVRWVCLPAAMAVGLATYWSLGLIVLPLLFALAIGNVVAGQVASRLVVTIGEQVLRTLFIVSLGAFVLYLLAR